MTEGWIKISRGINEHWIWKDPIKFQWWIDMLITVNFKDSKVNIGNQLIECKRGQSLLSLQSWGLRWKVDKNKVRNFFVLLEKDGMITHENLSKTTRITICKYESYQGIENAIETQSKRNQNAFKTQSNPIEESKEEKESKEGEESINNVGLDFEKIKDLFNHTCEHITKITTISESRKKLINARIKDAKPDDVYQFFESIFQKVNNSNFLCGLSSGKWKASFDWILKKENIIKIIEGNYDNVTGTTQNGNNSQWANGSVDGIQRPTGKQPYVFSGAEFSAKMQERLKNQGIID